MLRIPAKLILFSVYLHTISPNLIPVLSIQVYLIRSYCDMTGIPETQNIGPIDACATDIKVFQRKRNPGSDS